MKMIADRDAVALLKDFVDDYLERGLGGYSGRELELLVLELCMELHPEFKEMPVFEKSRLLKASETKIKNMLYEIKLRRADNPQELIRQIEKSLGSMEIDKGKVIIEMDDLYSKKKLKAILKEKGTVADSSFNSDLMKISFSGFISVVVELFPEKSRQRQVEDLLQTQELAQSFSDLTADLKIPGTDINAKNLWDFACKAAKIVKARIDDALESGN